MPRPRPARRCAGGAVRVDIGHHQPRALFGLGDGEAKIGQRVGLCRSCGLLLIGRGLLVACRQLAEVDLDGLALAVTPHGDITRLAGRVGADQTGEFLSPNTQLERTTVADETSARLLDLLTSATVARFDGSDLMPAPVGTGTFWAGMRSFFGGEQIDAVIDEIQAGWTTGD